jgi:hypothetical protein
VTAVVASNPREQTIDGFPEWVGVRRVIAKVFRHLVVVLNAVDPSIGEGAVSGGGHLLVAMHLSY